ARQKLMSHRSKRIRPQLDDKILLGWNALMNTAYAKAYAATGKESMKEMAIRNMQFLEDKLQPEDGNWQHTYKNGIARIPAFLDDLAYLIQSYIHLQEITGKSEYLLKAKALTERVIRDFEETETGFFFYTRFDQKDVIIRKKEVYDGAVPSGNAIMASNLHYLSLVFDKPEWAERSRNLIRSLGNAIIRYPGSFGVWANALQIQVRGMFEIALIGQQAERDLYPVLERYIPNKILQAAETNSQDFPLLAGKEAGQDGATAYYLCRDYTCKAPFFTVKALLANV
ncbi:MAG: thioredoxin domain-containing protein, partial [Bacteroidota bacterium]|nr:thioredoxin domain-containing protein [Bacteroidota bacterium]